MSCTFEDRSDIAAGYVAGTLDESEIEPFELHMLSCAECREAVTVAAAVRQELTRTSPALRGLRRQSLRNRLVAGGALVALAAASIFIAIRWRTATPLAAFTPPTFVGETVRGGGPTDSSRALVDRGMDAYARRDFARAEQLLASALPSDSSAGVSFYLAAAQLARGHARDAIRSARRAMRPSDNPFAADAHVLAAKAWLSMGAADSAIAELESVHGDPHAMTRATALRDSIRRARR